MSTQAQVVNLLEDLPRLPWMSYLFIGHNFAVVSHLSNRLAILYRGQLVEIGSSQTVYRRPRHPYTQALIGAILSTDPTRSTDRTSSEWGRGRSRAMSKWSGTE